MAKKPKTLVPKGFNWLCSTAPTPGTYKAEVYHSPARDSFVVVLDDERVFGPVNSRQFGVAIHAMLDAQDMKGRHGKV